MAQDLQALLQAHYERLASSYDDNLRYSPDFVNWMSTRIVGHLDPQPGDRIADLGCGTGLHSVGLAQRAGSVVCVDPFQAMLDELPDDPSFFPICASAEDVGAGKVALPHDELDGVLMKEAVHHIEDIPAFMRGLAALMAPGGQVLIVTLPPVLEYPLFQAALDRFRDRQPDPEEVVARSMREAGLSAEVTFDAYPHSLTTEQYIRMVRSRYMSVLSTFSDEELEAGIAEIRQRHPDERVDYPDRFAFVLGTRPS